MMHVDEALPAGGDSGNDSNLYFIVLQTRKLAGWTDAAYPPSDTNPSEPTGSCSQGRGRAGGRT